MSLLRYYAQLARHAVGRVPFLTALIVFILAVGLAVSMTAYTLARATSGDPIPWKSSRLLVPQLDNWGPDARQNGEPPIMLSYQDAMALMRTHAAYRQSALYAVGMSLIPDDERLAAFHVTARATYADFFSLFDVPFRYGTPWSSNDDAAAASAVVISAALNDRLFKGANSVGRTLNLDGTIFRITGVLREWHPRPRVYDAANSAFGEPEQLYLPFTAAIARQMPARGYTACNQPTPSDWAGYLGSECVWIQFWIEVRTSDEARRYRELLHSYAAEQQRIGRFTWSPLVKLRNAREWLEYLDIVPGYVAVTFVLAIGFLLICIVNSVGLILAKFAGRQREVGIRRALGASRQDIFLQYVVEAAAIGIPASLLGLLLTWAGLAAQRAILPAELRELARLDGWVVQIALLAGLLCAICAGTYPAWHVSGTDPASAIRRS